MNIRHLIIKVDNEGVSMSPALKIKLQDTNIPFQFLRFRDHKAIFWKTELMEYVHETRTWRLKVLDYNVTDTADFSRQKSTKEVFRLGFEKLDWKRLEPQLSSYQKIKLSEILINGGATERYAIIPLTEEPENVFAAASTSIPSNEKAAVAEIKNVQAKFSVHFHEAKIRLGYIAFEKNIKEVGEPVKFKIQNDFLLPEFDNIKSWIARKLSTRKFNVTATITLNGSQITNVKAYSPEIALIDEALIETIKYQRTLGLTKAIPFSKPDQSLFTADDIFNSPEFGNEEGNIFSQNEQDILNALIGSDKIRNRKQLEYLSGQKQSDKNKLRFTLYPLFGFLFHIEGEQNNHYVWELLNSHATYIWTIGKHDADNALQYKRIENAINTIRDAGRDNYKRAYRQNHLDHDLVLSVIEHEKVNSDFIDGFVKWKHRLNEKLT